MRSVAIVFLLVLSANCFGQILPDSIDERALQFKVKQIDEFMNRFNYDISYDGARVKDRKDTELRKKNMYTLFNLDQFGDSIGYPNELVKKFCDDIIRKDVRIHYEDTTWQAELVCEATFNNKLRKISLLLQTEKIREYEYKWVIADVSGDLFETGDQAELQGLLISPAEHGINFMTLPATITSHAKAVAVLSPQGHREDKLSVFNFLVSHGILKIKSIKEVKYHFYLPDYCFEVERIEKDQSYNTGWLINKIEVNHQNQ